MISTNHGKRLVSVPPMSYSLLKDAVDNEPSTIQVAIEMVRNQLFFYQDLLNSLHSGIESSRQKNTFIRFRA